MHDWLTSAQEPGADTHMLPQNVHCLFQLNQIPFHDENTELSFPIDRELVDLNDVWEDICSKHVLGNMVVRCYDHERGCKWTGDLTQRHTHSDHCQLTPQEQQDTDTALLSSDIINELTTHVEECEGSLMNKDKEIAFLK